MSDNATGRERADMRTAQLKTFILAWEEKRDTLCDEIAFREGQVALLEQNIKEAYGRILAVNKEEQREELKRHVKQPPKGAKTPKPLGGRKGSK